MHRFPPGNVISEYAKQMQNIVQRNPVRATGAATVGASLLAAGVALVVNVLMARTLGPAARGNVAWLLQLAYVGAPLLTLGVDRLALRGELRSPRNVRYRHVWILAVLATAVGAFLLRSTEALLAVGVACNGAIIALERASGIADRRLGRYLLIHASYQTWVLASSGLLAFLDVSDTNLWLGVYVVPLLWIFPLSARHHGPTVVDDVVPGRWAANRRSLLLMAGGFSVLFAARVERLLLPVLASSRELGLYVSVATASELLVWASRGVGDSRVRILGASERSSPSRLAKMLVKDASILTAVAAVLALAIWMVLIPLLGSGFEDATELVVPLCASSVAWSLHLQVSAAWLARGSGLQSMSYDLSVALLTTISVFVLIPPYGALGAAIGCGATYLTAVCLGVVFVPRIREAGNGPAQG